jgi:hypothetical protein
MPPRHRRLSRPALLLQRFANRKKSPHLNTRRITGCGVCQPAAVVCTGCCFMPVSLHKNRVLEIPASGFSYAGVNRWGPSGVACGIRQKPACCFAQAHTYHYPPFLQCPAARGRKARFVSRSKPAVFKVIHNLCLLKTLSCTGFYTVECAGAPMAKAAKT